MKNLTYYMQIYGISLLTSILPFAFAPIVARHLSISDFGKYNWSQSLVYLLLPMLSLGMQTGARLVLSGKQKGNIKPFFEQILSTVVVFMLLMVLLIWSFSISFFWGEADLYFSMFELFNIAMLAFMIAIVSFINVYHEVTGRFRLKSVQLLAVNLLVYLIVYILISVGPLIRVYGQVVAYLLLLFVIIRTLGLRYRHPNRQTFVTILRIGLPLAFISFIELGAFNLDKYWMLNYRGDEMLGSYTAAFYFYSLVAFGAAPLSPLIETYYYQSDTNYKYLYYFIILILFIGGLMLFEFKEIIVNLIFGEGYDEIRDYVVIPYVAGCLKFAFDFSKVKLTKEELQNISLYVYLVVMLVVVIGIEHVLRMGHEVYWVFLIFSGGYGMATILNNCILLWKRRIN